MLACTAVVANAGVVLLQVGEVRPSEEGMPSQQLQAMIRKNQVGVAPELVSVSGPRPV